MKCLRDKAGLEVNFGPVQPWEGRMDAFLSAARRRRHKRDGVLYRAHGKAPRQGCGFAGKFQFH